MRQGARLGIDVGKARIGVARCDPAGMLAVPVETVSRDHAGNADIERIAEIAEEYAAFELIIGLPLALAGHSTPSTADAKEFAIRLASAGHTVRLIDERLSTVSAQSAMREVGRSTKRSRKVIDQAAAVIILQTALDAERVSGNPPGYGLENEHGLDNQHVRDNKGKQDL